VCSCLFSEEASVVSEKLTSLHKVKQLNLGFGGIHLQLLLSSHMVRHNKIYLVASD